MKTKKTCEHELCDKEVADSMGTYHVSGETCSKCGMHELNWETKELYELKHCSGSGTEYLDGDWEYSDTPTFHVFTRTRKAIYNSAHVGDKVKLRKTVYEKGDTFYPNRAGVPHWFKFKQV